jgi:hypothetical protein
MARRAYSRCASYSRCSYSPLLRALGAPPYSRLLAFSPLLSPVRLCTLAAPVPRLRLRTLGASVLLVRRTLVAPLLSVRLCTLVRRTLVAHVLSVAPLYSRCALGMGPYSQCASVLGAHWAWVRTLSAPLASRCASGVDPHVLFCKDARLTQGPSRLSKVF